MTGGGGFKKRPHPSGGGGDFSGTTQFKLSGVENKCTEIRKKRCLLFFRSCGVHLNQI